MNVRKMTRLLVLLLFLCLIGVAVVAQGTPEIGRWVLGGGGGPSTGGNVSLWGVLGQPVTGRSTGGNIVLKSGFRFGGGAHRVYVPVVLRDFTYYAPPCAASNRYCEDNDTFATAYGPVVLGAEYRGYPNDKYDYYTFWLDSTQSVTIRLQNYQAIGDLILYDAAHSVRGQWGKGGSTMTVGPISLGRGLYYVLVHTASGQNTPTRYSLTVAH